MLSHAVLILQPWQVPRSKLHTPEEWDTLQAEVHASNKGGEGIASQGSGVLDSVMKAEADVKVEPQEADKPVKEQRKALTLKERLEVCQATERQRLSFCKVGTSCPLKALSGPGRHSSFIELTKCTLT